MSILDILIEKVVSDDAIISVLADILSFRREDICLFRSVDEFHDCDSLLVCSLTEFSSGYRYMLSIFPRYDLSISESEFAINFAQKIHSNCLIGDDKIDPYTMVLFTEYGTRSSVSLDVSCLDIQGVYVVAGGE